MAEEMRATVYLGPEQIELRRVPIPEPQAGELLVKVRAATTCGTDVKTYRRGHPKFPPPFIFGHEFAGDVVKVGVGVKKFREGMRVTANVFAECGECFYCKRGQGNLCVNLVYNFGAFAEYMVIPASIVRRATFEIPPHISYANAALLEPLVTVVHGWHKLAVRPGETVAILGAGGPISLMFIQLLERAGAGDVIAVGHSTRRLEVARTLGATHLLNAREQDTVRAVRELTHSFGADVVIECAGTKSTWETSVEVVRRGGRVLWFGGLPGGVKVEVDAAHVHYGEIDLLNMHGGTTEDACEAFDLIASGKINPAPLLNGELPLEQVETALKKMIAGEVVKVVINPDL
ncbi:MAG TPA: zinc-binding dehydrogenase [Anaerolineales bacterium]|nr:zinc-binding dehydrogenase [Anaerolineales bacterium]